MDGEPLCRRDLSMPQARFQQYVSRYHHWITANQVRGVQEAVAPTQGRLKCVFGPLLRSCLCVPLQDVEETVLERQALSGTDVGLSAAAA